VPSAGPAVASAGGLPGRGGALGGGGAPGGFEPFGDRSATSPGGGTGGEVTSNALVATLKSGASGYRWAAATSGSQSAASLELAAGGVPVMAIGGFSNEGGNLSLAQFQAYVKAGQIHYYIAAGGGFGASAGGPGGGSSTSAITSWVKAHYRAETIGGQTVYDLTKPL
jgi:hypothetical protein